MIVSIVQYLPDGDRGGRAAEISDRYAEEYDAMRRRGYWFAVELHRSGAMSVSVENRRREADCETLPNREGLRTALESMLQRRVWQKQAPKVNNYVAAY